MYGDWGKVGSIDFSCTPSKTPWISGLHCTPNYYGSATYHQSSIYRTNRLISTIIMDSYINNTNSRFITQTIGCNNHSLHFLACHVTTNNQAIYHLPVNIYTSTNVTITELLIIYVGLWILDSNKSTNCRKISIY